MYYTKWKTSNLWKKICNEMSDDNTCKLVQTETSFLNSDLWNSWDKELSTSTDIKQKITDYIVRYLMCAAHKLR